MCYYNNYRYLENLHTLSQRGFEKQTA
ncbi:hypothetical protein C6N14_06315 [Enterococcus mundtii]|uniref:Uncharacterized protein n=1 Tax=Enterococcus mundtii TaxID=53346 RepID=A0A2T5DD39_ENTMU|nr:hypothetical protein C6N14_06315 [Enterococcus mundtii]